MTVKLLKARCKELGLSRYSRCKKAELIKMIKDNQPKAIEAPKVKTPSPVLVVDTTTPPLPTNLSHSPMTPEASIVEDEVLSDLDEFIGDYDNNMKKIEEEKIAEKKRMKKEMLEKLEKIKIEEEMRMAEKQKNRIIEELASGMINDVIKIASKELKAEKPKPKPKPMKKQLKRPRKMKKQPKKLDLSSISIKDLIAEATKRGYRMTKIQKLNMKQMNLLANTVDDLDMLSDDEE